MNSELARTMTAGRMLRPGQLLTRFRSCPPPPCDRKPGVRGCGAAVATARSIRRPRPGRRRRRPRRARATPATRSPGARASVTSASICPVSTKENSAVRCHFVWSKIPITRSHASTISRLILTSSGLRSMRPRSSADPARPEEALADAGAAEDARGEVADERHRGVPQNAARDDHAHARSVREGAGDAQAVRDHDELPPVPQLERNVEGGGARVESDRLAVADHRGRSARDCALGCLLHAQPDVEGRLRLPRLERAGSTANPGYEALSRKIRKVASYGHLRHREGLSELDHGNGVSHLE